MNQELRPNVPEGVQWLLADICHTDELLPAGGES